MSNCFKRERRFSTEGDDSLDVFAEANPGLITCAPRRGRQVYHSSSGGKSMLIFLRREHDARAQRASRLVINPDGD